VRKEAKTPIQEWGWQYLVRQEASGRPLSPHLGIYKPQLTWVVSGAHRILGCIMAGSIFLNLKRLGQS
jgi:succinate dehydrogenase (ubiquinone) cytochrome b560 subunit